MRVSEMARNIREVNGALADSILSAEADARRFAAMPKGEREARLGRRPWPEQRLIRRFVGTLKKS